MGYRAVVGVGLLVLTAVAARPSTDSPISEDGQYYNFQYNVSDSVSGDIKSHSETRRGSELNGVYRFVQPDGCVRVVHYTANVMGFHPTVTYEGNCQSVPLQRVAPPPADDPRKLILQPGNGPVDLSGLEQSAATWTDNSPSDTITQIDPSGTVHLLDGRSAQHPPASHYQSNSETYVAKSAQFAARSDQLQPINALKYLQSARQPAVSHLDVLTTVQSVLSDQLNDGTLQPTAFRSAKPHSAHQTGHNHFTAHRIDDYFENVPRSAVEPHWKTAISSDLPFDHSVDKESHLEPVEYFIPESVFRTASFNPETETTLSGHPLDHISVLDSSAFDRPGFQVVEHPAVELNSYHPQDHALNVELTPAPSVKGHGPTLPENAYVPDMISGSSMMPKESDPTQIVVTRIESSSEDLSFENPEPRITADASGIDNADIENGNVERDDAETETSVPDVQPGTSCTASEHFPTRSGAKSAKPGTVSEDVPELKSATPLADDRAPKTISKIPKPATARTESRRRPAERLVPHTIRIINSHMNPAGWNPGRQITSEIIRRPDADTDEPITWKPPAFQVVRNSQRSRNSARFANRQSANRYRSLPDLESSVAGSYGMRIPGYVRQRTVPEYIPLRYSEPSESVRKTQWSPFYRSTQIE